MAGLINTGRDSLRLPAGLTRAMAAVIDKTLGAVSDQVKTAQLSVEGEEFIPHSGPGIVASNHGSLLDARLLNSASPRALTTVEVSRRVGVDLTRQRGHRDWPVLADRLFAQDELVLVFPEGRRSPDGRLHKGLAGLGSMIMHAQGSHPQIPVIPASVTTSGWGAQIRFGAPLDFSRFGGLPIDRTVARGITDEVMAAILELAEIGYGDTYTVTARDAQRGHAREEVKERRRQAAAQRVAEQVAVQAHRWEVAQEIDDLDRRAASAADHARRHAQQAAERDAQRGRRDS